MGHRSRHRLFEFEPNVTRRPRHWPPQLLTTDDVASAKPSQRHRLLKDPAPDPDDLWLNAPAITLRSEPRSPTRRTHRAEHPSLAKDKLSGRTPTDAKELPTHVSRPAIRRALVEHDLFCFEEAVYPLPLAK